MLHSPHHIAEVLRDAIRSIEQNADVSPDHPDLVELKRIVQQRFALLESASTLAPTGQNVPAGEAADFAN